MGEDMKKPKTPPRRRITLTHPRMKGEANVWKKDLQAWLDKGWVEKNPVKSPQNKTETEE